MLESLFYKLPSLQACNVTKKRLLHKCFPVKFEKFWRTPISKNIWTTASVYWLLHHILIFTIHCRGSEFSSYETNLRKRVTQNGVTIRVTNSKSKNKNLHFELTTRRLNFYFLTFELLTQIKLKNKKLHLKLLTRSRKIKVFTLSYWLEVEK